jgi:hypothetical protein
VSRNYDDEQFIFGLRRAYRSMVIERYSAGSLD